MTSISDSVVLRVERVNAFGFGVAFRQGKKHYIPFTLPGEEVRAVPESGRREGVFCRLEEVLQASPDRKRPVCPHFGECGGCDLQQASYAEQLRLKQSWIESLFGGKAGLVIDPIVPSPLEYRYRNRVTLHAEGDRIGFLRKRGRGLVEVTDCAIASDAVNAKLRAVRESPPTGLKDGMEIRETEGASFVQVNAAQNENLVALVVERARGRKSRRFLELYAGSGNLTFALAGLCREIVAVESDVAAVAAGERERIRRGLGGVRFVNATAYDAVHRFVSEMESFDAVVCDPPREGLGEVAKILSKLKASRIVCVSCDPRSLARDAASLEAKGCRMTRLTPLDMFPQTRHVEAVAVFEGRGVVD